MKRQLFVELSGPFVGRVVGASMAHSRKLVWMKRSALPFVFGV
jgi:hypothetical protein